MGRFFRDMMDSFKMYESLRETRFRASESVCIEEE